MKINKVYPAFYNGVTEQVPELAQDSQCKEMINCIPDVVLGTSKRPPAKHIVARTDLPQASKVCHTYNRGEDEEEYIFVATGDLVDPLEIYEQDGTKKTINWDSTGDSLGLRQYVQATTPSSLKGLTVQDRTYLVNREKVPQLTSASVDTSNFTTNVEFSSLSATPTSSVYNSIDNMYHNTYGLHLTLTLVVEGVSYNSFAYWTKDTYTSSPNTHLSITDEANRLLGGMINDVTGGSVVKATRDGMIIVTSAKVDITLNAVITDLATDTEDHRHSQTLTVDTTITEQYNVTPEAYYWISKASNDSTQPWRYVVYLDGTKFETIEDNTLDAATTLSDLINVNIHFHSAVVGSTIQIQRVDKTDFTFSSWDSYGSSASVGWKDTIDDIAELPRILGFEDTLVKVTGNDESKFNDYYITSTVDGWTETRSPADTRRDLTNMPITIDRGADGTFYVKYVDWAKPLVGDVNTNPSPSFVGEAITDIFFFKNRLGISSGQGVVLSESADYSNFFIKSVLSLLSTDPIDVALASVTARNIKYVKPFQGELYIFTEDAQFALRAEGVFSPTTVGIVSLSNYLMASNVEPVASGNSLFFVSNTAGRQQLREYRKSDFNLTAKGTDLSLATPTYMNETITGLQVNNALGTVLCTTASNLCYVYLYKESDGERVQSSMSKWTFYNGNTDIIEDSFEYIILANSLLIMYKTATHYVYNSVELTKSTLPDSDNPPIYPSDILYPGATLYPSGTSYSDDGHDGTFPYTSEITLPSWYPKTVGNMGSPKDKVLIKKVLIEGDGRFDAHVYRNDYKTTYSKTHEYTTIQDLDIHVNSRVDRCDIYISDSSTADFVIRSITMEGLFSPTSQQTR